MRAPPWRNNPIAQRPKGFSKLDYARVILACLAAIAQRQGDAFGLIVASDGGLQLTPASRGPRQFQRVLARAQQAKPVVT